MNENYIPPSGYPPAPGYPPPVRNQGIGCFAKGCIATLIILFVSGVLIAGGLGWYGYSTVRPFLSTRPLPLHSAPATDAQYANLQARIQAFETTLASDHTATLKLSADDLNTYIARELGAKNLRGRVHLAIVNNELAAETSAPLPTDKNRPAARPVYYFNGRIYFSVSFENGALAFEFHKLETLDGKPPSALVTAMLENPNFNRGFNQSFNESFRKGLSRNPAAVAFLDQIRTVNIQDNQVVLTAGDRQPDTVR